MTPVLSASDQWSVATVQQLGFCITDCYLPRLLPRKAPPPRAPTRNPAITSLHRVSRSRPLPRSLAPSRWLLSSPLLFRLLFSPQWRRPRLSRPRREELVQSLGWLLQQSLLRHLVRLSSSPPRSRLQHCRRLTGRSIRLRRAESLLRRARRARRNWRRRHRHHSRCPPRGASINPILVPTRSGKCRRHRRPWRKNRPLRRRREKRVRAEDHLRPTPSAERSTLLGGRRRQRRLTPLAERLIRLGIRCRREDRRKRNPRRRQRGAPRWKCRSPRPTFKPPPRRRVANHKIPSGALKRVRLGSLLLQRRGRSAELQRRLQHKLLRGNLHPRSELQWRSPRTNPRTK